MLYGLIRLLSFFNHTPLWWGITILIIGTVSGIIGVAFALGQHDIKRLLAYHSIENIGIITMGIGLALIGQSSSMPLLTVLGLAGALLHVLNHALFKSLLFLCAGAVINACHHDREIDHMGGLAKRMPATATCFLVGAVAICGLPPLNGFVSEFFIYLGMFRGVLTGNGAAVPILALAAPALALIGALAVACFVKVYGIAFLGTPRTTAAEAREANALMLVPMAIIAFFCLFIGIAPIVVVPLLEKTIFSFNPEIAISAPRLSQAAPMAWLSWGALALIGIIACLVIIYRQRLRKSTVTTSETWGCGYLAPAPRMQYSASSFAGMLAGLSSGVLHPREKLPEISTLFPKPSRFSSHIPEVFLELCYQPLLHWLNSKCARVRKLQSGQLHFYILYIVLTLLLLLAWSHLTVH